VQLATKGGDIDWNNF